MGIFHLVITIALFSRLKESSGEEDAAIPIASLSQNTTHLKGMHIDHLSCIILHHYQKLCVYDHHTFGSAFLVLISCMFGILFN